MQNVLKKPDTIKTSPPHLQQIVPHYLKNCKSNFKKSIVFSIKQIFPQISKYFRNSHHLSITQPYLSTQGTSVLKSPMTFKWITLTKDVTAIQEIYRMAISGEMLCDLKRVNSAKQYKYVNLPLHVAEHVCRRRRRCGSLRCWLLLLLLYRRRSSTRHTCFTSDYIQQNIAPRGAAAERRGMLSTSCSKLDFMPSDVLRRSMSSSPVLPLHCGTARANNALYCNMIGSYIVYIPAARRNAAASVVQASTLPDHNHELQ